MKKAILFTLAALCVSAVQALTYSWTTTENASGDISLSGDSIVGTVIFSFVAPADLSACKQNANNPILMLGSKSGIQAGVQLDNNNATAGRTAYTADGGTSYGANYTFGTFELGKENTIAVIFRKPDASSTYVDLYINGTFLSGGESAVKWTNNAGIANQKMDLISIGDGLTGTLYYTANTLTEQELRDKIATVPEPTALALLALGLAGLALKRKVA